MSVEPGAEEPGRLANSFVGTADVVFQARDIYGDVHIHAMDGYVRASRSQLRSDIPDFTDRTREVAELTALLDNGSNVVCVWGTGGTGKSTLAVRIGHLVRERFPYAQLYVDLRGADAHPVDPAAVLGRFLLVLGVSARDIPSDLGAREDLYRAALWDKPALVVLDNAHSERQVRPLLPGTGTARVLVTSRQPMQGLAGTEFVELKEFDPASATELLRRTSRTADALDDLAGLCGHLPLALRIVGVKLRLGSTTAVRRDLADASRRLAVLRAGDLSVRASIAVSHGPLPEPLKRCFRLLSLIPGADFAEDAAAAALGMAGPELTEAVRELAEQQLLEWTTPDRLRFHDLLRLYAREEAERSEPPEVWDEVALRHVEWCRARAQEHRDNALNEECPTAAGLRWFDVESANVLEALESAFRLQAWTPAFRLAMAVQDFLRYRGLLREAAHVLGRAADAARGAGEPDDERFALVYLGMVLVEDGRTAETPALYERALALPGSDVERCWTLTHYGIALTRMGHPDEAITRISEALAATTSRADGTGEAWASTHLGNAYRAAGRPTEAVALLQGALDHDRADHGDREIGWILVYLADALADVERWAEAEAALRRSLELGRTLGDLNRQAWVLHHLGEFHARRRHWPELADTTRQLETVAKAMHNERWLAIAAELVARHPIASITITNQPPDEPPPREPDD
ncbi:tetratricopeptide repeat protein [Actinokineospora auranticolor]|uniref:NB-ARC domain-containing protein n=1 Tax=Actinokineospora auranticolor TaxID=155976 RepID=A0A2S6GK41_9PSEU|nr:tetratricopeptide repeat protein [Actinokineospora auranticolor]PPK65575.1 NB-ARC domain-containing protein [Actinokineospora auranticolor]